MSKKKKNVNAGKKKIVVEPKAKKKSIFDLNFNKKEESPQKKLFKTAIAAFMLVMICWPAYDIFMAKMVNHTTYTFDAFYYIIRGIIFSVLYTFASYYIDNNKNREE